VASRFHKRKICRSADDSILFSRLPGGVDGDASVDVNPLVACAEEFVLLQVRLILERTDDPCLPMWYHMGKEGVISSAVPVPQLPVKLGSSSEEEMLEGTCFGMGRVLQVGGRCSLPKEAEYSLSC
jgi:hypothetical protein